MVEKPFFLLINHRLFGFFFFSYLPFIFVAVDFHCSLGRIVKVLGVLSSDHSYIHLESRTRNFSENVCIAEAEVLKRWKYTKYSYRFDLLIFIFDTNSDSHYTEIYTNCIVLDIFNKATVVKCFS